MFFLKKASKYCFKMFVYQSQLETQRVNELKSGCDYDEW